MREEEGDEDGQEKIISVQRKKDEEMEEEKGEG